MNELSEEQKVEKARGYMRRSLEAFVRASLLYQEKGIGGAGVYGRMMAPLYREFRAKHKFYEVV